MKKLIVVSILAACLFAGCATIKFSQEEKDVMRKGLKPYISIVKDKIKEQIEELKK